MKNFNKISIALILGLFLFSTAYAVSVFQVQQGGSGVGTITGIIQGNGISPFSSIVVGSGLNFSGGTLSATGGGGSSATTTINGASGPTFTFNTGTSGSDFNIATSSGTIIFNIPSSSASSRGLLTSTDWSTFNGKENVLTFNSPLSRSVNAISISLASSTSNGYLSSTDWTTFNNKVSTTRAINTTAPITGGGDLSADRTIACNVASGSQAGCLSSADWTTFNNKQASGNYITALTGDVTASGPGSVATTLATVNSNTGSFGTATQSPTLTLNGKGLVTAAVNTTITPAVGSITGLGSGVATFLATPSSANLGSALTDKTGTGVSVFATSPTLVTPVLGVAGATSVSVGDDPYTSSWNGSTLVPTKNAVYDNFQAVVPDETIRAYQALGGTTQAQTVGMNITRITTGQSLASGVARFVAVYIPTYQTITGVQWYQIAQGVYTADTSNVVGLYTYSAGTITLVASSSDDGTIWKTAQAARGQKAFQATYNAVPGVYYIGVLYHTSAQTTAPSIGAATAVSLAVEAFAFTNSATLYASLTGQTALPTSQAMNGLTIQATPIWLGLY